MVGQERRGGGIEGGLEHLIWAANWPGYSMRAGEMKARVILEGRMGRVRAGTEPEEYIMCLTEGVAAPSWSAAVC